LDKFDKNLSDYFESNPPDDIKHTPDSIKHQFKIFNTMTNKNFSIIKELDKDIYNRIQLLNRYGIIPKDT
jgi:hypothetical protein